MIFVCLILGEPCGVKDLRILKIYIFWKVSEVKGFCEWLSCRKIAKELHGIHNRSTVNAFILTEVKGIIVVFRCCVNFTYGRT